MKHNHELNNKIENVLVFSSQINSVYFIVLVVLLLPFTVGYGPYLDIDPFYAGIFPAISILFLEFDKVFKHKRTLKSNYLLPVILFVSSIYLSFIFGLDYTNNAQLGIYDITLPTVFNIISKRLITYTLLCFLIYISINNINDIKKLIYAFIFSGFLINAFSLFLKFSNSGFEKGRFASVFEDPNMLGRFEVFIIIIFFCFLFFRKNPLWVNIFFIGNIAVCLYIQFLTYSRSSFISLSVIIILLGWLFFNSKKFKFSLLAAILIGLYFVLSKFAVLRIDSFSSTQAAGVGLLDVSNFWRILLNIVGFQMFLEKPIFGVGFLNYYNVFVNHANYLNDNPILYYSPVIHSWIFGVLAEAGLYGLISLCWILILTFKNIYKCIKNTANEYRLFGIILFSFLFVLIFNGLFYWYFIMELIFPVFLGIVLGYIKIITNEIR